VDGKVTQDDQALAELVRLLAADRSPLDDSCLQTACTLACRLLRADACAVALVQADGRETRLCQAGSPPDGEGTTAESSSPTSPPHTAIAFPRNGQGQPVGRLLLWPRLADGTGAALQAHVETVAGLFALALANRQLRLAAACKEAETDLLGAVDRLIDTSTDVVAGLRQVLQHAAQTTGRWYAACLWPEPGLLPVLTVVAADPADADALQVAIAADYASQRPSPGGAGAPIDVAPGGATGAFLAGAGLSQPRLVALQAQGRSLGLLLMARRGQAHRASWPGVAEALAERIAVALDRVRLFRLVERAKQEWETVVDTIADGVAILDLDFRVLRANWTFARLVGSTPWDVVGKRCHTLIHGLPSPCSDCPTSAVIAGGAAREQIGPELEVEGRHLATSVYPLRNNQSQLAGLVYVLRDITREKHLQEAVVRTERLRTLGEMATGVAHSFGNLLVSIRGWSEVLLDQTADEATRRPAEAIYQAALDGAEAVRRIQEYAGLRHATADAAVDVNAIVQDVLAFAQPRWRTVATRERVTFEVQTDLQPVPAVAGNAAELREVLLNLIFNAIDAMPGGGRLAVATRVAADGAVLISVSDTGGGIPAELHRRIFDPFFTTKGASGTGLGLAIAAGVVERHGGHIAVFSEGGKGSVFTVSLPPAGPQAACSSGQDSHRMAGTEPGHNETDLT